MTNISVVSVQIKVTLDKNQKQIEACELRRFQLAGMRDKILKIISGEKKQEKLINPNKIIYVSEVTTDPADPESPGKRKQDYWQNRIAKDFKPKVDETKKLQRLETIRKVEDQKKREGKRVIMPDSFKPMIGGSLGEDAPAPPPDIL